MAMQTLPRQLPPTPSFDVMDMLRQHVPLTLLLDVAFPCDPRPMDAASCA
jgi:hypothetical protein